MSLDSDPRPAPMRDDSYVVRCSDCRTYAPVETFHNNGRYCSLCHEARQKIRRNRRMIHREINRADGMLRSARNRAKKEGFEFSITLEDIAIPEKCPVLRLPLTKQLGLGRRVALSPSLDRKDNTKGYVPGNVWVISWRANFLKSNATVAELKKIVRAMQKIERENRDRTTPAETLDGEKG